MFEYDRYYRECQQLNKPFIKARINPVHKNYFVQLDLVTCSYGLSVMAQEEIKKLTKNEIDFVKSNLTYDFNGYNIDCELAWFDGISREHVNDFCESLYDVAQKYHN